MLAVVFLGPFLKLCLYLDGWLNACIAIERTVNVSKGVTFNKKMSRHMARYIIVILPILIMGTIIHEPIQHEIFEYPIQKYERMECPPFCGSGARLHSPCRAAIASAVCLSGRCRR